MPTFPVSYLDPFADDFLGAPYPFYAELRDAGPAVWLERYGLCALSGP
jgi:4-methoxybenzoate monooxygenase (O-demethylating)